MALFRSLTLAAALDAAILAAGIAPAQMDRPIRLGESLPPLDVDYVKGGDVKQPGGTTITVVEFWATWCQPCKLTIPHLSELQAHYGDRGLQVIGVSDETAEIVEPFVDSMGEKMEYNVAIDRAGRTTSRFREPDSGIPQAFLFNELGTLIWIGHPADPELEQLIRELTDELSEE